MMNRTLAIEIYCKIQAELSASGIICQRKILFRKILLGNSPDAGQMFYNSKEKDIIHIVRHLSLVRQ
jgi:hypothetical protein